MIYCILIKHCNKSGKYDFCGATVRGVENMSSPNQPFIINDLVWTKEINVIVSYLVDTWWGLMIQHISKPSNLFKKVLCKDVLLRWPLSSPNPYQIMVKWFNCLILVILGFVIIWICINRQRGFHFISFDREMTSGVKVKVKKVKKILSLKSTRNCPICIENWKKNFEIFFHTKMKKLRIFYHMRCSFF